MAGLPDPRKDHALVMARFAHRCLRRSKQVLKKLEVMLGPDTADLKIRFGLHSGPVTAGVLRGERSRFQLFGDVSKDLLFYRSSIAELTNKSLRSMNTASRMESTSLPNRIQVSEATAKLLRTSGKDTWIQPRLDAIDVKGKGVMKTFFIRESLCDSDDCSVVSSHSGGDNGFDQYDQEAKQFRQVQWTVEVMGGLLKEVRSKRGDALQGDLNNDELHDSAKTVDDLPTRAGVNVLDEV